MFPARVEELLDLLIDLPVSERSARLAELCAGDEAVRAEVAALVEAYEASSTFLRPLSRVGPRPADQLGRYRVLAEIGRGAMGVVCLAHDGELGRNVALKTLTSEASGTKARRERLREEARMLAAVNQPNIAQVYSFEEVVPPAVAAVAGERHGGGGSDDVVHLDAGSRREDAATVAFLTMEYVPGTTLGELVRSGPLPLATALEFGRQIAAALEAAHAQGVVHRDLKPQNIRVTPDGWVKVLDFGLAFSPESGPDASRRFCGTPGYMSPEQVEGGPVGAASDLWSFGCVLYECLTGRSAIPTTGDVFEPAQFAIDRDPLPAELAPLLGALLDRLFAVAAETRPSATEARRQLEEELLRLRAHAFFAGAPPLASAAPEGTPVARGNLPRRLSEFVGRDALLAEAEALLSGHRLLTLTGTGGAGKTRLALELGARCASRYPGGVWFVDLSTIESGAGVGSTGAHALGVRDAQGDAGSVSLAVAVARTLGSAPTLVVVDNCEHVLAEASEWITALLETCPHLTILATSRTPLGTPDEQVLVVAPLLLPGDPADFAACRASEAVRLFEARARSRQPTFRVRDDQLTVITEICRRADGLPLAIEIAAGHARALPADEILARLEANPLSLVAPGGVARSGRHRSLAGVVRWSYRLLGRAERLLFERLSVFRGGWTLASAEAVCARDGLSGWQLCDLLARLVERSLVEVETLEGDGLARYRLLETIQRFARERLERRDGEPEATESRYVDHCAAFLAPLAGEDALGVAWMARVDAEHANLNEALEICLRRGWRQRAVTIVGLAGRYWVSAGLWREGASFLRRTFALPETPGDPSYARELTRAYGAASRLHAMLEERALAAAAAEEEMRWAERCGDRKLVGTAMSDRGLVHWFALEVDEAETCFREALVIFTELGDRLGIATSVGNLAAIHGYRGEHTEALAGFQRQGVLSSELGDRLNAAKALLSVGRSLILLGRPAEALAPLEEAQAVHHEFHDLPGTALALHNLGDTYTALGRFDEARGSLLEAARLRLQLGNRQGVCSVLLGLCAVLMKTRDTEALAVIHGGVARAFDEAGKHAPPARTKILATLDETTESALGAEAAGAARARGANMDLAALYSWLERRLSP